MNAKSLRVAPVLNGFVIYIGCQIVVLKSVQELACEISRYYTNPASVEKEYIKNAVNNAEAPPPIGEFPPPYESTLLSPDGGANILR